MRRRTFISTSAATGITLLQGCGGGDESDGISIVDEHIDARRQALLVNPARPIRTLHAPVLRGATSGTILINGKLTHSADQVPIFVRITVNAGDDVVAASRLMVSGPDTLVVNPGDNLDISVTHDVTAIYLLGVGSSAAPADYIGGSYIISQYENDISDALANQARLTFTEPSVRRLRISISAVYETYKMTVSILGGVDA